MSQEQPQRIADPTMTLAEAIAGGFANRKSLETAAGAAQIYACIARLAAELPEDGKLCALATIVEADRSAMGRRARDLASELARRVFTLQATSKLVEPHP